MPLHLQCRDRAIYAISSYRAIYAIYLGATSAPRHVAVAAAWAWLAPGMCDPLLCSAFSTKLLVKAVMVLLVLVLLLLLRPFIATPILAQLLLLLLLLLLSPADT